MVSILFVCVLFIVFRHLLGAVLPLIATETPKPSPAAASEAVSLDTSVHACPCPGETLPTSSTNPATPISNPMPREFRRVCRIVLPPYEKRKKMPPARWIALKI